jgi:hypothetical protein
MKNKTYISEVPPSEVRIVKFTNGVVRDASLKVPTGRYSIAALADLIRESYLDWRFDGASGLFSDEVALSSIGKSHFFEGALGGFETRLDADTFARLRDNVNSDYCLAISIAERRNPELSHKAAMLVAAKNRALSMSDRRCMELIAEMDL